MRKHEIEQSLHKTKYLRKINSDKCQNLTLMILIETKLENIHIVLQRCQLCFSREDANEEMLKIDSTITKKNFSIN